MTVFIPDEEVPVMGPSCVVPELNEELVAAVSTRVREAMGIFGVVAVVLVLRFDAASKLSPSSTSCCLAPPAPTASFNRL